MYYIGRFPIEIKTEIRYLIMCYLNLIFRSRAFKHKGSLGVTFFSVCPSANFGTLHRQPQKPVKPVFMQWLSQTHAPSSVRWETLAMPLTKQIRNSEIWVFVFRIGWDFGFVNNIVSIQKYTPMTPQGTSHAYKLSLPPRRTLCEAMVRGIYKRKNSQNL